MRTVIAGLLIPFIGTAAGSAWSLIIPAIEQSAAKGRWAFLPAFIGFWFGVLFLLLLDRVIPHLHRNIDKTEQNEGPKNHFSRTLKMVLAVTLHNIPEGAIISMPLYTEGKNKLSSFWLGVLSGAVEPVFGCCTGISQ